jgi:hypothetical protein
VSIRLGRRSGSHRRRLELERVPQLQHLHRHPRQLLLELGHEGRLEVVEQDGGAVAPELLQLALQGLRRGWPEMSASCWSLLGKLVSISTALRFLALLRTCQSLVVGPVSPLIATETSPSVTTKPQDSTGCVTGIDFTW